MKLWEKISKIGSKEVYFRIWSFLLLLLLLTLVLSTLPSPLNSAPIQNLDLLAHKIPELIDQNLDRRNFVYSFIQTNKDLRGVLKPLSIKIKVYLDQFLSA